MITAPPGWVAHADGDGLVLVPPGGVGHGTIRYRERVRPLRPVRELVAGLAPPGRIEHRRGAIERMVTSEGEHAALVTSLASGTLTVRKGAGATETWRVSGGFFEVSNNRATVLADSVETEVAKK